MIKEDYEQLVTTPYSLISKLWKFANGRFDASFFHIFDYNAIHLFSGKTSQDCIMYTTPFKFTIPFLQIL